MRRLNPEALNEYAVINGNLWKENLAVESKVPYPKIGRLIRGERTATELEMDGLCRATSRSKDQLFPIVEKKKKSA